MKKKPKKPAVGAKRKARTLAYPYLFAVSMFDLEIKDVEGFAHELKGRPDRSMRYF